MPINRRRIHEPECEQTKWQDAVLAERCRIAEELHDGLAQNLNATLLYLGSIRDEFVGTGNGLADHLDRIRELTRESLLATSRAVWSLADDRSPDEDPGSALRRAADHVFAGTAVTLHVSSEVQPSSLLQDVREAIVRIGKEGLVNAMKHAAATEVRVTLIYADDCARLMVEDNGRGITHSWRPTGAGGFGLMHVRARAEQIGGTVAVEEVPQHGTRLVAVLPLGRAATLSTRQWQSGSVPRRRESDRSPAPSLTANEEITQACAGD